MGLLRLLIVVIGMIMTIGGFYAAYVYYDFFLGALLVIVGVGSGYVSIVS